MKRNASKASAWRPATETLRGRDVTTGMSYPLGATVAAAGANFSLFSRSATRVELLFFDREDDSRNSMAIACTGHGIRPAVCDSIPPR